MVLMISVVLVSDISHLCTASRCTVVDIKRIRVKTADISTAVTVPMSLVTELTTTKSLTEKVPADDLMTYLKLTCCWPDM